MTATRSPRIYRDFDPNVGGGVDRDTLDASDFAGKNRSFPIDKPGDVDDAWHSVGRAKDNYPIPTLMLNIIKIAKAKRPRFIAHLPDPNDDQDPKVQTALKAAKGALKGSEIPAYFLERAAFLAAEAVANDAKPAQPGDDAAGRIRPFPLCLSRPPKRHTDRTWDHGFGHGASSPYPQLVNPQIAAASDIHTKRLQLLKVRRAIEKRRPGPGDRRDDPQAAEPVARIAGEAESATERALTY